MSEATISRLEAVAARLEAAVSNLEHHGGASGARSAAGGAGEEKTPVQIIAYDAFYASHVQPLVDTCKKIAGVEEIGTAYEKAFKAQRDLFLAASQCKKPNQNELMKFVDPIVQVVSKAQTCDNRHPQFAHHKTFAETIQLMNWMFQPGPVAVIKGTLEAADFYLIKILTSAKDANEEDKKNHRAYVQQTKEIIGNFADFVKEHYLTGLIWNAKGKNLSEFQSGGGSSATVSPPPPAPVVHGGGGVPPPPPPVDASVSISTSAPAVQGDKPRAGGLGAIFAEINNKGEGGVTSGLKKVTSDMKTKNMKEAPALQPKERTGAASTTVAPKTEEKKAPSLTLKQGTWFCENYEDTQIDIPEVQMKQSVYILKAKNAVINIPDKCKSIQLDNCVKTGVVFNSVVSSFEIVNCKSVTVQVLDVCPSISIDKTSGCSVILTGKSVLDPPNIVTSLVAELNVVIPGENAEADPIEMPVPQQYVTTLKDGKLTTEALLHKG